MRVSQGLQRRPFDESVCSQGLLLFWEFGYRQTQVIQFIELWQDLRRLL